MGALGWIEKSLLCCSYKLFLCLNNSGPESSLTSRLRGSDNSERFVIPAQAGIQDIKGKLIVLAEFGIEPL